MNPPARLLQKIRAEKRPGPIAAGQIKRDKPLPPITDEEKPFELPEGVGVGEATRVGYPSGDGLHGRLTTRLQVSTTL